MSDREAVTSSRAVRPFRRRILRSGRAACSKCGGSARGCFACSGLGWVPAEDVVLHLESLSGSDCDRIPGVERFVVGRWAGGAHGAFPVERVEGDRC